MFSISPIIFIKCPNRHQMKNNIRYNGNINNASVIIFFKSQKLPAMVLCLRDPPQRFFCCCCIFISFLIFICRCFSFADFLHSHFICFLTSSLTLPWIIAGFLHPFYTFSAAHHRVICDTFIFQLFCYLLTTSATVLSGNFLPTGVFYITLLHRHFNLRLSRLPWEPAVLP